MKFNFHFPEPFAHDHPPVKNVNEVLDEQKTAGQAAADWFSHLVGSWKFIIIQTIILGIWIILNLVAYINHWDPYPFILMNLVLSMQAAYAGPILMMSQNRQAERDRLEAHNDFLINQKAETEIRRILEHLEAQNEAVKEIHRMLDEKRNGSPE
jgi:uncharacterized membrane protein